MDNATKTGLSRRGFMAALTAGGAAAAAAPAAAAPNRPAVRPGRHAPVRALHGDTPYWDFSGRAPEAKARKARPQTPLSQLSLAQRYMMGL